MELFRPWYAAKKKLSRRASCEAVRLRGFYRGCLLSGALGDALGAPVEFDSLQSIRSRFGEGGIRDFALA